MIFPPLRPLNCPLHTSRTQQQFAVSAVRYLARHSVNSTSAGVSAARLPVHPRLLKMPASPRPIAAGPRADEPSTTATSQLPLPGMGMNRPPRGLDAATLRVVIGHGDFAESC